jgi:hypothetical protein
MPVYFGFSFLFNARHRTWFLSKIDPPFSYGTLNMIPAAQFSQDKYLIVQIFSATGEIIRYTYFYGTGYYHNLYS